VLVEAANVELAALHFVVYLPCAMFSFKMCACSNDARVLKYAVGHKNDVGFELVKGDF
jgi:hypothetical protein